MNLIDEVDKLLDSDIKEINKLLPNDCEDWTDAIDFAFKHEGSYYFTPSHRTRADHIHRRLGHLVVNPHNKYNTNAITESYVFKNDKGLNGDFVNYSPETTQKFIEDLVESARQQYELTHSQDEIDPTGRSLAMSRLFILHGERGTGKTFFLNYLLSRFSTYFDKNKTIWVRLNLVEGFGKENNLKHWLYAQATKIIFRYYDENSALYDKMQPKSPPIPAIEKLNEFVKNLKTNPDHERYLLNSIIGMKQVFYDFKRDEPVTPELVPLPLGREVVTIAQSFGYSFVVVLDGLDCLEITQGAKDKFEELTRQAFELIESNELIGMTFVAVARTNTLNSLSNTEVDPYRLSQGSAKQLDNVELQNILQKRLAHIEKEVQEIATTKYQDWNLTDWPAHLLEFQAFLHRDDGEIKYIDRLEKVLGANKRAQMNVIQLNYYDFLRAKREQPYQLIESLVKSGRRFPPKHYTYKKDGEGKLVATGHRPHFDSRFFPTILVFPYVASESHPKSIPTKEGMLMGIRCLQLVSAHDSIHIETLKSPLLVSELAELCNKLFGYPEELVMALVLEYTEFELFRLRGKFFPIPSSPERYEIIPLPKMNYLLNQFLHDIAYLNLSAMRLPLSVSVFKNFGPYPFISAATFDDPHKDDLLHWIGIKILNAIAVHRLIKQINNEQQQRYAMGLSCITNRRLQQTAVKAKQKGMFSIAEQMQIKIKEQIRSAISNLQHEIENRKSDISILEKLVQGYIDVWL